MLTMIFLLATGGSAGAQQGSGVFYPAAAQEQGLGGTAVLECLVGDEGRLACDVVEETPAGMGFGAAAVRTSASWRIAAHTRAGVPTAGGRIRRTVVFEPGPPVRVLVDPPSVNGYRWEEQPSASDYARLYPREARRRGLSGYVTISCIVNDSYGLDCEVANEEPYGVGFGDATLRIAEKFRIATHTDSGEPTRGGTVRRTIRWMMH